MWWKIYITKNWSLEYYYDKSYNILTKNWSLKRHFNSLIRNNQKPEEPEQTDMVPVEGVHHEVIVVDGDAMTAMTLLVTPVQ